MPELLTVTEVAATLRISPQTVRCLIRRDELPGVRVGNLYRIPKAAVARLVNAERDPEPAVT